MCPFSLTNKMVVERCQALFASSKAVFNFPNANREKSRKQLEKHIEEKKPIVAYISDYQGAGKSTLMDMAVNTFGFRSSRPGMVRVRDVSRPRLEEDLGNFGTLFIDDVDIRTSWQKIVDGINLVREFEIENPCPIVICGDFTIRNEEIRGILDSLPRRDIAMEAVDRQFLLEALNHRLRYLFKINDDELPDEANCIFDDELLNCLVPDSAIPIATFREVLTLSEGISQEIEPTNDEFRLAREHAERYCEGRPLSGPTSQQWLFLKFWLKPFVTVVHPRGQGMKSFLAEDVLSTCEIPGINDAPALENSVLEPLCAGGILHALGVPCMRDGKFHRYPGPYLPRPLFLLHAYAGGDSWPFEGE